MRKTHHVITEPFEKLKQEKITFTWTTLLRLLKLGGDVLALYIHYCSTARLQSKVVGNYINTIKATSVYSMNGLNLSSERFHKAKNLLLDNGMIEDYTPRNDKGQVKGHYIKIHYLLKNTVDIESASEIHPIENPEDSLSKIWKTQRTEKPEINTMDKKGNTIDKKGNTKNKEENNNTITTDGSMPLKEENPTIAQPASHNILTESYEAETVTEDERKALQVVAELDELMPYTKTKFLNLKKKDKKAYYERVKGIAFWINKGRTAKDFINLAAKLAENPYYKQIHLMTLITQMGHTRLNETPTFVREAKLDEIIQKSKEQERVELNKKQVEEEARKKIDKVLEPFKIHIGWLKERVNGSFEIKKYINQYKSKLSEEEYAEIVKYAEK